MKKVVVIGGGAAGMMAAIQARETNPNAEVFLIEKNEKLGKKIYITGKGRCNVTNSVPMDEYLANYPSNEKFLYSAFSTFSNRDLMNFIEKNGTPLKEERGNRVFPVSDHASDITKAFSKALRNCGVKVLLNTEVKDLLVIPFENPPGLEKKEKYEGLVHGVRLSTGEEMEVDSVILATGGLSYSTTGSTGDGHRMLESLGISVTECYPALVPLLLSDDEIPELEGLSLRNVELHIKYGRKLKKEYSRMGEMVFTRNGISGPLVLTGSSVVTKSLTEEGELPAWIDFKPAISFDELEQRVLRELSGNENRNLSNIMTKLLPGRLALIFLHKIEIPTETKVHDLTKEQRRKIVEGLKHYPLTIIGTEGFRQAIVTQGGVRVKEVNPKTMEVKKIKNLYVCGELLDVDGFTGGFNLQAAFSTGYVAGRAAVED